MCDRNTDALGAVHRAATAYRDDDVAAFVAIDLSAQHHFLGTRIGRDLGKQMVVNVLAGQACLDVADPPCGNHTWVGNQQHLACAKVLRVVASTVPTTRTKHDLGGNEFALQTKIGAHTTAYSYYFVTFAKPTVFYDQSNPQRCIRP